MYSNHAQRRHLEEAVLPPLVRLCRILSLRHDEHALPVSSPCEESVLYLVCMYDRPTRLSLVIHISSWNHIGKDRLRDLAIPAAFHAVILPAVTYEDLYLQHSAEHEADQDP